MTGNPIYTVGQVLCRIWTTLWFDLKVFGAENVPRRGGVLIVSNHQSYLDPVLVGVRLKRPTSYFAKSELFKNPFFDRLIRTLGAFPVRQGEGDIGALREAIAQLQEGKALVLFPEGTRTETGELSPIEKGVGLIVKKAGVPVVPCIIEGSYQAWPRALKVFRTGRIYVHFGPVMELQSLKSPAIVQKIGDVFAQMHANLRQRMAEEA